MSGKSEGSVHSWLNWTRPSCMEKHTMENNRTALAHLHRRIVVKGIIGWLELKSWQLGDKIQEERRSPLVKLVLFDSQRTIRHRTWPSHPIPSSHLQNAQAFLSPGDPVDQPFAKRKERNAGYIRTPHLWPFLPQTEGCEFFHVITCCSTSSGET